jgi:hypothetical protein
MMICARDKGMQGLNSGSRNPNMRGSTLVGAQVNYWLCIFGLNGISCQLLIGGKCMFSCQGRWSAIHHKVVTCVLVPLGYQAISFVRYALAVYLLHLQPY